LSRLYRSLCHTSRLWSIGIFFLAIFFINFRPGLVLDDVATPFFRDELMGLGYDERPEREV